MIAVTIIRLMTPTEQVDAQPRVDTRHNVDKARITDQLRELTVQMDLDVLCVVCLEAAVLALMEVD
jgi:hypothetical protein